MNLPFLLQLNLEQNITLGPWPVLKGISPNLRHLAGNIKAPARSLGVVFDQNLNSEHHIKRSFFLHPRNIAKITPVLPMNNKQAFISSRLD